MRRPSLALGLILAMTAALGGCGSSEGAPPPPVLGGFTPAGQAAILFPPTTCDIAFLGPTSVSGLAIVQTDFPDACAFATSTQLCGSRAGSAFVLAVAVQGAVGGTTGPLAPATFPFLANPPSGAFLAATASAVRTDAVCTAVAPGSLGMAGGRIVVSTLGASRATGTLDLRFEDGSALAAPFDLPLCAPPADLCTLLEFGRCVPGVSPWVCQPR